MNNDNNTFYLPKIVHNMKANSAGDIMNNKYEAILEAATEWLDNVDADEFLENFLVLQEQATEPTVHEFLNGSFAQEAIGVENSDSDSKEGYF